MHLLTSSMTIPLKTALSSSTLKPDENINTPSGQQLTHGPKASEQGVYLPAKPTADCAQWHGSLGDGQSPHSRQVRVTQPGAASPKRLCIVTQSPGTKQAGSVCTCVQSLTHVISTCVFLATRREIGVCDPDSCSPGLRNQSFRDHNWVQS